MTKEEAIAYGNDYYRDLTTACCEIDKKHKEFVRMSLEALEQQPCPYWDYGLNTCRHANIGALATKPCEDAISREEVLDILKAEWVLDKPIEEWSVYRDVVDLPSVTPIRPKGEWIKFDHELVRYIECSKCTNAYRDDGYNHWNFCPNCGADMRGEKE